MKLLHKILLATDFSESSELAMHKAIQLAKSFDSEILILHVIPSMELSNLNKEMVQKGVKTELKKVYDKIKSEGLKVHDIGLQVGIPFVRIIKEADDNNVNVIIMGSGEKKSFAAKNSDMLGITAEKVLHKSAKPVWVVSSKSNQNIDNILCPVDFSKPAERAIKNAIHLSRKFKAKLSILHAVPSLLDFYLNIVGGSEDKLAEKISNHTIQLDKFLSQFDFHDVKVEKIVKPGKVHRIILDTANELKTNLIVMGTSGESNNPKVLMGTNTKYVIRELPSSIITVKSEGVIQPMIDYQISDMESHYNLGLQFLNNGMPKEAMEQFRYCVDMDALYAPAWEGLASSYDRLGYTESAAEYRQNAKEIKEKLWQRKVEAELRSKHEVLGKKQKN